LASYLYFLPSTQVGYFCQHWQWHAATPPHQVSQCSGPTENLSLFRIHEKSASHAEASQKLAFASSSDIINAQLQLLSKLYVKLYVLSSHHCSSWLVTDSQCEVITTTLQLQCTTLSFESSLQPSSSLPCSSMASCSSSSSWCTSSSSSQKSQKTDCPFETTELLESLLLSSQPVCKDGQ